MEDKNIISEGVFIITIILITITIVVASILVIVKAYVTINNYLKNKKLEKFNKSFKGLTPEEIKKLELRKRNLT